MRDMKALFLHLAVLAALLAALPLLSAYHVTNVAKIMVLAVYAMGYNIAFGYTGLLSLGHALFFAAGLYAAGRGISQFGLGSAGTLVAGPVAGGLIAAAVGVLALRTAGV